MTIPAARPFAEITADARRAPCLECGAVPLEDCACLGMHLIRIAEARREGLISAGDMKRVTRGAVMAAAPFLADEVAA